MRKCISWGGRGIAVAVALLVGSWGWAIQNSPKVKSTGSSTIVVDEVFQFNTPSPQWDSQAKNDPNAVAKWVLHQAGRNPLIRLKYEFDPAHLKGKTIHHFPEFVKNQYQSKGIRIQNMEMRQINGRNVALLYGLDPKKDDRYLIGVWRDKNRGYIMECSSDQDDFVALMSGFKTTIETARILKKH